MSDYIDRLLKQTEDLLWWTPVEATTPTGEHAILRDGFDKLAWDNLLGEAKSLREISDSLGEEFQEPGERALEDLFNIFYQTDPRLAEVADLADPFKGNQQLMSEFSASEEVASLRNFSMLDEYHAGFALLDMEESLREALARSQEAQDGAQGAQDSAQAAQEALWGAAQAAQDAAGTPGEQQAGQGLEAALAAAQQAQDALDAANATAQGVAQDAARDLEHAAGQAKQKIKDTNAQAATYGYGPGELKLMDFDERRNLSQRLHSGKLKRFAELIGQWTLKSRAMRRQKVKHEPGVVTDYELGQDLTRLAPSERDAMVIPELADHFLLRFVNHELLLEVEQGVEQLGRGPILVVCDESQSMESVLDVKGNTREAWSKALTLALASQARKEQRDFTYIGFDSSICFEETYPKGRLSLNQLIDFVEHFGRGGTRFMEPLQRAFSMIEEAEARGLAKADIVFITDGDAPVDPTFAQTFREGLTRQDATCYAIQVGASSEATRGLQTLNQLTDKVMQITQLNADADGVAQLFRNI